MINQLQRNYSQVQQNNYKKKNPAFGIKINMDKNMEGIIANFPENERNKVQRALKRIEKLGKQEIETEEKRFFGLLSPKKTVKVVEPTSSLSAYIYYDKFFKRNIAEVAGTFSTTDGKFGNNFMWLKTFLKNPAKNIVHLINNAKKREPLLTRISK